MSGFRIGFGFDVHRLEKGLPLWLGGVKIPSDLGSAGHSDADVLIHALCDALLGAAALGDIGQHFPDSDPAFKDTPSRYFLETVMGMIKNERWTPVNIDITVCLEEPRIAPFRDDVIGNLSAITGLNADAISVKATTTEGLGFAGRREGISAYAVVLIRRDGIT
ncbi:MAG: 2-C-methyl-D-erythritol 2,4-cyclodiphosphate synthase [Bacteroidales bacterium]|nr:2-C-methyl-D-erythritol 2,4-cyclodiphosphate synthase [Bacteroidales bacterium]